MSEIAQAVTTAPTTPAMIGKPGVTIATLMAALKCSDKTIRRGLKRLGDEGRVHIGGKTETGADLDAPAH